MKCDFLPIIRIFAYAMWSPSMQPYIIIIIIFIIIIIIIIFIIIIIILFSGI